MENIDVSKYKDDDVLHRSGVLRKDYCSPGYEPHSMSSYMQEIVDGSPAQHRTQRSPANPVVKDDCGL